MGTARRNDFETAAQVCDATNLESEEVGVRSAHT